MAAAEAKRKVLERMTMRHSRERQTVVAWLGMPGFGRGDVRLSAITEFYWNHCGEIKR
jgi:hypothetical protein